MIASMFTVAGRRFSLRSRRPATWFTPVAVFLLVSVANSSAIALQRDDGDATWWLELPIMGIALVASADCLERLVSIPPHKAHVGRLATLTLVTLMLSSGFFGPFTFGIVRWAAVVIGVPWAVMVWLTLRELARLMRKRSTGSNSEPISAASH